MVPLRCDVIRALFAKYYFSYTFIKLTIIPIEKHFGGKKSYLNNETFTARRSSTRRTESEIK